MQKYIVFLCSLVLCLLFASCEQSGQTDDSYQVYYLTGNPRFGDPSLEAEVISIPGEDRVVEALLDRLLQGPSHDDLVRALPEGTELRGFRMEDGVLTVDFSRHYGRLSGIALTLADYSVTMTLNQLPGVDSVVTTVEGEGISYRNHQNLNEGDLILGLYRESSQERPVTLYVPTYEGSEMILTAYEDVVTLKEDDSLIRSTLQALSTRTTLEGVQTLPTQSSILSVQLREGVCSLNLSPSFFEAAAENPQENVAILKALTKTLCGLDNISALCLLEDGKTVGHYGTVPLEETLQLTQGGNLKLLENNDSVKVLESKF